MASGFLPPEAIDMISRDNSRARQLLEESPKSVSMILGPDGQPISEVIRDEEGIVYADIDLAKCVVPKQFQDVVGYYNRFDVFQLKVNRRALAPVEFSSHPEERNRRGRGRRPERSPLQFRRHRPRTAQCLTRSAMARYCNSAIVHQSILQWSIAVRPRSAGPPISSRRELKPV
ncbi:hypothetical protein ACU4GD_26000 [Cupriavidus basilensis]